MYEQRYRIRRNYSSVVQYFMESVKEFLWFFDFNISSSCIGYFTKFSRKVPCYALIPLSLVFGGAKIFTKMLIRNFTKPKKPLKFDVKFHDYAINFT